MLAKLPRLIASAGVLGALVVAAPAAPHLAHTHAALHAHRHVPAAVAPRRMPALVAVVIRGDVYVIRADGRGRRRLTGDRHATSPRLSPTQRQVAYVDTVRSHRGASPYLTPGDVWVVAVRSARARRLTAAPVADLATPSWSPDGRRLAFYAGTAIAVCVVATDRCTSVLRSGHGARWDSSTPGIAWSPDSAHLLIGTPAGVREEGYPAVSPLQQPTHFMFSPNAAYLAMDPDNRLWVAHADGTQGRFYDLQLARNCVLAQSTWLADSSGLAYVTLCTVPSSSTVLVRSRLYSITVHGATPHLLYALTDPDQGNVDLAPAYRCVDCG